MLYVNANEMAWVLNLVENTRATTTTLSNLQAGAVLYNRNCMVCHGPERLGGGDYPSILAAGKKYNFKQFNELLSTGRRMMPGFNHLTAEEKDALAAFILDDKNEQAKPFKGLLGTVAGAKAQSKISYSSTGYNKFLTREGYPAISPPWGTLNAINLNTGQYMWKIPLGEFEELKAKGIPPTGRENYGGSVVTAGGLLFIAATADGKFRAINKKNGKILFETDLPAPGVATPAVYAVDGTQYVVIACGGSKWGGQSSDTYVAFSLSR
jgi:quinoprotein glucose dehydrogenase